MTTLHVTTYNIHKGFSPLNRHVTVHELREQLRSLNSDILFLQEVQGLHLGHAQRHSNWPEQPQHQFLAEAHWPDCAYGGNMAYKNGHHGNAILSRYPILHSHNQDVTHLRFEKRGLLHCRLQLPNDLTAHCVCVHLSLFGHSRRWQLQALVSHLAEAVPPEEPLIIAGDFNDWRNQADRLLVKTLGLHEAFSAEGAPVRSFPAHRPLFRLDRIYVRGFSVQSTTCHAGGPWARISDHAALSAHLCLTHTGHAH